MLTPRYLALLSVGALGTGDPQSFFTEEAITRGIVVLLSGDATNFGTGLGFGDLDGDGDPDLVVVGDVQGRPRLFENQGGAFLDRTPSSGMPLVMKATGVTMADYDADGDLDLYLSANRSGNVLMENVGGFVFTDATRKVGAVGDAGGSQGSAWGDYDGDGWLDLYVANHDEDPPSFGANRLYRNLNGTRFVEVGGELGVDAVGDPLTFQPTFVDYDLDGWLDLYLCTDKGQGCIEASNHLFRNLGGTFQEVTLASGTEACVGCMGTAVGDADGNGYPDFYCTNLSIGNVLLMNQGTGSYYDQTAPAAVASNRLGWGTVFLDYDNDGWEDLYVCNHGSNRLYRNGASWPMQDEAPSLGVGTFGLLSHCVASADVDGDGDLDFAVEAYSQLLRLFINHEGDDQSWLTLRLRSSGRNTHAIGARVEIVVDGLRQTRQVLAGVGLKSMSTTDLHFGLGQAGSVDLLTVSWPDGRQSQLVDVPANQLLELWEPGGLRPGRPQQR